MTVRANQSGDDDGTRRTEVLETAASLIATSGLRTSMHDIATAAGIQTGSLYHHFASKEALLVELLRRYHTDLDRVAAQALDVLDDPASRPGFAQIAALGTAIARSAVAHSAALQLSIYETPSSNPELIEWTQRRPTAILDAMYQTLRAARWAGYVRSDVELASARRPADPDDAASRTRRHAPRRAHGPGGHAIVPNPVGRACDRPPHRRRAGSVRRLPRRGRSHRQLGRRSRRRRQDRPHPRGGACRVWAQGLRRHHGPRHRRRGGSRPRHRVSTDRVEGRTPRLDHAIVRGQGRGGFAGRLSLQLVGDREVGRVELGQHQRAEPVRRRVPHSACMDAPDTPRRPQPEHPVPPAIEADEITSQ